MTDPLGLRHRVHVSADDGGFRASCACGWSTSRPSRELRQRDIDAHRSVPRSHGSHGLISEGD